MAMDETTLADDMASALGETTTSSKLEGWAKGLIEGIQAGAATFGGSPGPHTISGLIGPSIASLIQDYAGYPSPGPSAELTAFCTAIANYIMLSGIVTYDGPGGTEWYTEGTISGLDGNAMASAVQIQVPFPSVSSKLLAQCTAIANHIVNNAEVDTGVIS